MIHTEKDLSIFLENFLTKKVFILSGKNSFYKSKAHNFFGKSLKTNNLVPI